MYNSHTEDELLEDWELELLLGYSPIETPIFHQMVERRGYSRDLFLDWF